MKKAIALICSFFLFLNIAVFAFVPGAHADEEYDEDDFVSYPSFDFDDIPEMTDSAVVELNYGYPEFLIEDLFTDEYYYLSELDELGRAGPAMACIGKGSIPDEPRTAAAQIDPSGWNNTIYEDIIPDKYLYNRSHLLGYQMTGINGDERNLFTGTAFLNKDCMVPFETKVTEYVKSTGNHVIYRVTPVFVEDELVPRGVILEAFSVEDLGSSICMNVFIYNVQPGIEIDYRDGSSKPDKAYDPDTSLLTASLGSLGDMLTGKALPVTASIGAVAAAAEASQPEKPQEPSYNYVLNTNSHKFHYPSCSSVSDMKSKNRKDFCGSRDEVIAMGYEPCKRCNP